MKRWISEKSGLTPLDPFMKKEIPKTIRTNCLAATFMILTIVFGFGCDSSKPTPDPLIGFHAASKALNPSIINDYQTYIQSLSAEEKQNLGPYPAKFFEDDTGRHAVEIIIGINGRWWRHVLVYDEGNRRIKTIKQATGHYRS